MCHFSTTLLMQTEFCLSNPTYLCYINGYSFVSKWHERQLNDLKDCLIWWLHQEVWTFCEIFQLSDKWSWNVLQSLRSLLQDQNGLEIPWLVLLYHKDFHIFHGHSWSSHDVYLISLGNPGFSSSTNMTSTFNYVQYLTSQDVKPETLHNQDWLFVLQLTPMVA